jgi:hypothetical protein
MNVFRKFITLITGYLVLYAQVSAEIGRIAADFFRSRWQRFLELPGAERAFTALTLIVAVFTFLPWRNYVIRFGDEAPRKHGIYSDDFALILVGCMIALLPNVRYLIPKTAGKLKRSAIVRYAGLAIVALFAIWNFIDPFRVAAAKEAAFAWSFYVFQASTLSWVITGVLGARCYAQYPDKN